MHTVGRRAEHHASRNLDSYRDHHLDRNHKHCCDTAAGYGSMGPGQLGNRQKAGMVVALESGSVQAVLGWDEAPQ